MAPMRPPSSPRQPPDTVFHCVSGRKIDVGRARAAVWQRPADRWRDKIDFARSGRVSNMAPEGLLRSSPRTAAPRDYFSAPRAQRTHGASGDCNGLSDCVWPLLRPGYLSHRYCALARRRASLVCRSPDEDMPHHTWAHSSAQIGVWCIGSLWYIFVCAWGTPLYCCIPDYAAGPDSQSMSQALQQQRPETGNGHYQQIASCHGLPGERPPPLARLLTVLIGALDVGAAACSKTGCAGELGTPPCTTRFTVVWGVSCVQVPGAEYATPPTGYRLRCPPTAHTDCSQLSQPLCAGFGTIRRGLVRPIYHSL